MLGLLVYFVVDGLYSFLDKRSEAQQAPVNPLVTNAPADTRNISKDYPQGAFPNPKLEEDERGQLNDIRIKEEQTLSSYDYIDKNAGTVRIPIERAMELIAQRGLPVQTRRWQHRSLHRAVTRGRRRERSERAESQSSDHGSAKLPERSEGLPVTARQRISTPPDVFQLLR